MHVANASLRKDYINKSNRLQVKFCHIVIQQHVKLKTKCFFFVQKYPIFQLVGLREVKEEQLQLKVKVSLVPDEFHVTMLLSLMSPLHALCYTATRRVWPLCRRLVRART